MSKTMEDLPGKQFDYLLVIGRGQPVKRKDGRYDSTFICRCKCGSIVSAKESLLKEETQQAVDVKDLKVSV